MIKAESITPLAAQKTSLVAPESGNKAQYQPRTALLLQGNLCLPLRFPFNLLFGSEEVLRTGYIMFPIV